MNKELWQKIEGETFTLSPENVNGVKSGGSRNLPNEKLSPRRILQPEETIVLADIDGEGIVESMWFGGYVGARYILRIFWDNEKNPSVEAPLSAFFGHAFYADVTGADGNYNFLNSAKIMVAPCRGFNCYWQMPFKKRCMITLENRSETVLDVYYSITWRKCGIGNDFRYFCASYRQAFPVKSGAEYIALDNVKCSGHLAGITLAVNVNEPDCCWCEGEVKMYLDGEAYPTVNYTGTEDYFGGAFCFGKEIECRKYGQYSGLYQGVYSISGGLNNGISNVGKKFMLYRFHEKDPITFTNDIKVTIQCIYYDFDKNEWHYRNDDYATVVYWYQDSPKADLPALPSDNEIQLP